MIREVLVTVVSIAFVSGQVLAHDDLKSGKAKPKPEAEKDAKAGKGQDHKKTGDHKGKDHDKKH